MNPYPIITDNSEQVQPKVQLTYTYILRCNNGKTYTGHTADLNKRLMRHQKGWVPATKDIRPVELITYLAFTDKYKAINFEKYLKSGSGRAFMKKRLI